MQLDIFEHSRNVILRNAAIDALREWNAGSGVRAIAALAAEYGGDSLLPALGVLCRNVNTPLAIPLAPDVARAMLRETEGAVTAAANEVFGRAANEWLAPFWAELAAAIAGYPFAAGDESLHAAPLLLRAGRWEAAAQSIEGIASWRRQPAPLAWMIEARCRSAGFESIWPLLAELAWMAPARAAALAPRLELAALDALLRNFDAGFEGEGRPEDFAWFPAWALLVDRRLAADLRLTMDGANTRPESCARIVLGLLARERQGRHAELIEGRRKLREAHPALFARYMQDR